MSKDPDFQDELPSEENIEEGRRNSLVLGIVMGAVVVAVGIIAYLIFGRTFTF